MHAEDTPYGYCKCGCGQKTSIARRTRSGRGWVKGEPVDWIHPSHKTRKPPEMRAGFKPPRLPDQQFVVNALTGCWIWVKARGPRGYGTVSRKTYGTGLAHKMIWQTHNGPVPEGLELDHLCQNPACVNPEHLEAVTHEENMRRGRMTRLTIDHVRDIRARWLNGEDPLALGDEFGVCKDHIIRIGRRISWREE